MFGLGNKGLIATLLFVSACQPLSKNTCDVVSEAITVGTAGSSSSVQLCSWNGSHSKPAFMVLAADWRIGAQLGGEVSADNTWTVVVWNGATVANEDPDIEVGKIDQPLASDNAAMFVHFYSPAHDLVSGEGGTVRMQGALPNAIGGGGTISFQFTAIQVAQGGDTPTSVEGTADLRIGIEHVQ
jgi:hypothetical protein